MQIEMDQVKKAVYSWSIRFRESNMSNDKLLFLSEEYYEDLVDECVSFKEFEYAKKKVRRKCSFFPKMSEILKEVEDYRRDPPASNSLQLEENAGHNAPPTAEQVKANSERLKILAKIACGDISHEDGATMMEALCGQ